MKRSKLLCTTLGLLAGGPALAMSLGTSGPAQPLPDAFEEGVAAPQAVPTTGSASLVPIMAPAHAEAQDVRNFHSLDDEPTSGGDEGKPVDDLTFVDLATESGRREVSSAREALTRLNDPDLREVAEVLAHHQDAANERLAEIAESKGWPVPETRPEVTAPAKGTATPDFDARWTDDMVAGHERALALYRAQAQGGEDKDLRKYARETLPTIEQHLDWLRSLQK
jgi:putative membrane protein